MQVDVRKLLKRPYYYRETYPNPYYIYVALPSIGVVYVVNNFLSGHVRMRGRNGGKYPYKYLEMIDSLFGSEPETIEVCSGDVVDAAVTVDINPDKNPTVVGDGEILFPIRGGTLNRWRCDPPYNESTAKKMYGTSLPNKYKLLKAGARVVKPSSLLFLLLGPVNYQICPPELKRIGIILITIVPNNEIRALNIYIKRDGF